MLSEKAKKLKSDQQHLQQSHLSHPGQGYMIQQAMPIDDYLKPPGIIPPEI